jgi:hypothetical protein
VSNDNVSKLIQRGCFDDQLTEILRQGARTLLARAVEAEVADFLAKHTGFKTEDGRQRLVRHGHGVCGALSPGSRGVDAVKFLKPETIIRWHRAGFRACWRWKSRRGSTRASDEMICFRPPSRYSHPGRSVGLVTASPQIATLLLRA